LDPVVRNLLATAEVHTECCGNS